MRRGRGSSPVAAGSSPERRSSFHFGQVPLIGLMVLAVYLLTDGLEGRAVSVSRWAVGVFAVFFSAYDAAAGVATGFALRSAQGLSAEVQAAVHEAVWDMPGLSLIFGLSIVGTGAWVVALIAAAMALRSAGASRGPFVLLILAGVFLLGGHPFPFGTLAFGCFFLATAWLELAPGGSLQPANPRAWVELRRCIQQRQKAHATDPAGQWSSGSRQGDLRIFTKLTDTTKAAIFSVLVLLLAVGAALVIRILELSPSMGMWVLWSITPTAAALVMLLVVTREGYSREGWKVLGLLRPGLSVWWIALGGTLLITVAASALVWATPLASFIMPEGGILDAVINFLIQVVMLALTFALAEEIGIRGYLLPKLLPLGRRRALALSGLVWATWHMPLILLTPVFPVGNKLISLPLFYAPIVAASFFYGYLRLYTGSVWPASIAHAVHNAAWGVLGAFTATSSAVLVNEYLVGDFGVLILAGAVIGAVLVGRMLRRGMDQAQAGGAAPKGTPAPAATEASR